MSVNCPVLSLVLHLNHEACWCSEFWKQFLTVIQGQKKLFTVISTCTLCQSDGREYSLYMRAWLTAFTLRWWALPHWCCPCLQQVNCKRSAASTIFSQRLVLNVQNRSKMQHFGRLRSVSCHKSCESVVHCPSAPLQRRSQATKRTRHAMNEWTFFSSAKGVTLRESPLSLAKNTKTWAPRQCQGQAICPQQPNIFLTSKDDDVDQSWKQGSLTALISSPYAKRPEKRWLCTWRSSFCWEKRVAVEALLLVMAPFRTEDVLTVLHRNDPPWPRLDSAVIKVVRDSFGSNKMCQFFLSKPIVYGTSS